MIPPIKIGTEEKNFERLVSDTETDSTGIKHMKSTHTLSHHWREIICFFFTATSLLAKIEFGLISPSYSKHRFRGKVIILDHFRAHLVMPLSQVAFSSEFLV